MAPLERALVSSYRPSIDPSLSLRVSEILPLLCVSEILCFSVPLFPNLPLVSSQFPHVSLTIGGWPMG